MNKISLFDKAIKEIEKVIIGKTDKLKLIVLSLLLESHILIEDLPGVGKTSIAKAIAKVFDLKFSRIQGSPDLMPIDILGFQYFKFKESSFEFLKGPLFANLILFDELNRTAPKTQSALLEVMQEKQITIEGKTFKVDTPFMVIATQNPYEVYGTYPLPVSQLDRFFMRLDIDYPDKENEIEILKLYKDKEVKYSLDNLKPIISKNDILEFKKFILNITIKDEILHYLLKIADKTRNNENILVGLSTRALLDLQKAAQINAFLDNRDYVIPDDVKKMIKYVVIHKLVFNDDLGFEQKYNLFKEEILNKIEVVSIGK